MTARLVFPPRPPIAPAALAAPSELASLPPPGPAVEAVKTTNRSLWASVESTNYTRYIANLRQANCPEQTIRDIVIADICLLYQERWHQRFGTASGAYWEPAFGRTPLVSEDAFREAAGMRTALKDNVRTLLGVDLEVELAKFGDFAHGPPELTFLLRGAVRPELIPVVAAAYERHRQCRNLIEQSGPISSEAVLALQRSRHTLRAELAKQLTATEIQEVEYRCSDAALEVRELLAGFPLSQAEFQALHRARSALLEAVALAAAAAASPLGPDELLQLSAAHELDEARIGAALGPERFAEYQRSRDLRYQEMQELGRERALPAAWVASLYDQEAEAAGLAAGIGEDPNLSGTEKEAALREAEIARMVRLRELLGAELAGKFGALLPGGP